MRSDLERDERQCEAEKHQQQGDPRSRAHDRRDDAEEERGDDREERNVPEPQTEARSLDRALEPLRAGQVCNRSLRPGEERVDVRTTCRPVRVLAWLVQMRFEQAADLRSPPPRRTG